MPHRTGLLVSILAAGLIVPAAIAQEIGARRMFFCDTPPCGQTAAAPAHTTTPKATPKTKSAPKTTSSAAATPAPHVPERAEIVPTVVEGKPLALRYRILDPDHGNAEVSAEKVFHANDRIQLAVETNSAGYLYVINQGSSGQWDVMFPRPEIANGNNHVDEKRVYLLPSEEHRMRFKDPAGAENLVIVLAREPIGDLEGFIYKLQSRPQDEPAADAPKQIVADARISDETVQKLHTLYSRDLIVEKVTPSAEVKETAVYVANPSGRADSRLITDLHLVHK
jgi:hypothetical protein